MLVEAADTLLGALVVPVEADRVVEDHGVAILAEQSDHGGQGLILPPCVLFLKLGQLLMQPVDLVVMVPLVVPVQLCQLVL